jgi:hypothetical protein
MSTESPIVPRIIRAQIKFKDFRTDHKAEINVPVEMLSRIKPLDMATVYKMSWDDPNKIHGSNRMSRFISRDVRRDQGLIQHTI